MNNEWCKNSIDLSKSNESAISRNSENYFRVHRELKQDILFNIPYIEYYISGKVNSTMVSDFLRAIEEYKISPYYGMADMLLINFSTVGGDVDDGIKIINLIDRFNKTDNTKTQICMLANSMIASMGLYIYISSPHRYAYENTDFMYHQISSLALGKLNEIESYTTYLNRVQLKLDNMLFSKTKFTKKELEKIKKDDYFFDSIQAEKYGIVTDLIVSSKEKTKNRSKRKCECDGEK
jgi:ATP-dependent protease ClpP protease subunit